MLFVFFLSALWHLFRIFNLSGPHRVMLHFCLDSLASKYTANVFQIQFVRFSLKINVSTAF